MNVDLNICSLSVVRDRANEAKSRENVKDLRFAVQWERHTVRTVNIAIIDNEEMHQNSFPSITSIKTNYPNLHS